MKFNDRDEARIRRSRGIAELRRVHLMADKRFYFQTATGEEEAFPPEAAEQDEGQAVDYARQCSLRAVSVGGFVIADFTNQ